MFRVRNICFLAITYTESYNIYNNVLSTDSMYYGMTLTKESKHRRNINFFGPTTLRATICYNMLRLAQPQAGDVIIDPLCGGGSIPIEV
jgi:23S rRNA G2445 N2-methylase RlmL